MKYTEFENIVSRPRVGRYLIACGGDTRKTMTLYRKNLRLSQEMFTVISCFEITLRNAIDKHYTNLLGNNWLRHAALPGGIFDHGQTQLTKVNINLALSKLNHSYTHFKLVAELGFGFWRYMFAQQQFRLGGNSLLSILPGKPTSTPTVHYNHTFIFNELAKVNNIRNRIAHHEPICFSGGQPVKTTAYARQHYAVILQLFQWMRIDESALLYGLDHITEVCNSIDDLWNH